MNEIDELAALPAGVRDWLIDMLKAIRSDVRIARECIEETRDEINRAEAKLVFARSNVESMLTDLGVILAQDDT